MSSLAEGGVRLENNHGQAFEDFLEIEDLANSSGNGQPVLVFQPFKYCQMKSKKVGMLESQQIQHIQNGEKRVSHSQNFC